MTVSCEMVLIAKLNLKRFPRITKTFCFDFYRVAKSSDFNNRPADFGICISCIIKQRLKHNNKAFSEKRQRF